MRWIARIFARAVVRRIAYVVVALVLASFSIGRASAANCASYADECSEGAAVSGAAGWGGAKAECVRITGPNGQVGGNRTARRVEGTGRGFFTVAAACSLNGVHQTDVSPRFPDQAQWFYTRGCSSEPSKTTSFFPPSGSMRCVGGCEVTYRQNADDTSTYSPNGKSCEKKPDCAAQGKNMVWNAMLGVCQPVTPECPGTQVLVGNACADEKPCPDGMALVNGSCKKKDEECPAGMTRSPLGSCIPGDGQCAQGEVRGKDGTCKKDKDGDGKPDPGEEGGNDEDGKPKDEFTGGDDCESPPTCSGSPIMCGQARIQWRIDCNTRRRVNISGGHCTQAGTPVCTGKECNAMEYAQLLLTWRSACAAEKLLAKGPGDSPGTSTTDANGNGVADVLEGIGDATGPGDGNEDVAGAKKWGIGVSTSLLNSENIFGGGSCPQPPSFTMMGSTISGADFPYFCQLAAIMRGLILIFGAFAAVKILMGWGFSG